MGVVGTRADALLVVPEPADWVAPVLEALEGAAGVQVYAPWVLPGAVTRLGGRLGFVRRRQSQHLPGARGRAWFTAGELLARAVARGKTAPTLANRVLQRGLVDRLVALRLARGPAPALVVAPSFAARHTFAAARRRGCTCLLLEDMPDFDSLVDGLDALSREHPEAAFLRNHRPRALDHAQQRAERWQADVIAVRGRVAWHRIGASKPRVLLPRAARPEPTSPGAAILFAGPPLARAGSLALPHLLGALPSRTIRVLPGPCSEPPSLLEHPRVQVDPRLQGVGAVLSLGPLESHPEAVAQALDRGIPVVGTSASTGLLDPASVALVEPDDVAAIAEAVERALTSGAPKPRAWAAPTTLAAWARAQYAVASKVTTAAT